MCNNKTIKELLPAYREQQVDQSEQSLVDSHLESCEDCRRELSLLRILSDEDVPDPGEAFWSAMPDRVHLAIQEQRSKRNVFDLTRVTDMMNLPRWSWTAAAVAVVLILSWFLLQPGHQEQVPAPSHENELVYDDPLTAGPVDVAGLGTHELERMNDWAGKQFAVIVGEAGQVMTTGHDTDIDEELAELNAKEAQRLSTMIDQWKREV